ncbi:MAG: VOC family protein [Alphaproteobacteria bacterium]|nr:MAG: VOC family protein [Alphaproteobacteria bacterium]
MISYFEIPVSDMDRAMAFYGKALGSRFTRQTIDGYDMALFAGDGPVHGALARGDVYVPGKAGPVLYFAVEDIRAVLARAVAAGGEMLYPVKDIGENGWVAEFADSEGNRIALSQPR